MPETKTQEISIYAARRELIGLGLLLLAVLLSLAIYSFHPADVSAVQSPPATPPNNLAGLWGAWTGYLVLMAFGMSGYLVPVLVVAVSLLCILGRGIGPDFRVLPKVAWMVLLLICVSCLLELLQEPLDGPVVGLNIGFAGGAVGHLLGSLVFIRLLGSVGAGVLLSGVVVLATVCLFDFQIARFVQNPSGNLGRWWRRVRGVFSRDPDEVTEPELPLEEVAPPVRERKRGVSAGARPSSGGFVEQDILFPDPIPAPVIPEPEPEPDPFDLVDSVFPEPPIPEPVFLEAEEDEDDDVEARLETEEAVEPEPSVFTPRPEETASSDDGEEQDVEFPEDMAGASRPVVWQLPPLDLLQEVVAPLASDGRREAYLQQLLENTLKQFGLDVKVTSVQRGPVVTSFELLPAPGVRVEKISNLSNNLALALKAESVRVQAPIPGKGVVGIEVPNVKSSVVFAREIVDSPEWARSKDWIKGKIALPLCLGVDVSGNRIVGDLADMPHLLIAGATGSGKSVCMNSLLAGLLMSRTPDQLRLILVDPKIVEFTAFRELPHLVVPVITDAKKVGIGLRWAITEMEKRYKLFAKVGVRNIKGYNSRPKVKQGDLFGAEDRPDPHPETLPYIVVVIDELADLMMVAQAEIEGYIARLAQLSRAVGIHMILATQRPSVNVITGTIKANFPARIAFQVAQRVDSRTILDSIGADKLLGKGDMLFLPPGSGKLLRVQGAWTSDDEINAIVDFVKAQGTPSYESKVSEKIADAAPELPDQEEDDDLVNQAVEVIRQTRRASTSSLQRRLRIGYNRAARLIDLLEERGIIGPPQGAEPREILIDLDGDIPQNQPE